MNDRTAHITLNGPRGTVTVAGHDMSHTAVALQLDHRAGEHPQLRLDLLLHEATIEGEAVVVVPDETASALVALGWTPPGEQPPAGWLEDALRSPSLRPAVEAEVRRLARIDRVWAREAIGHTCRP